MIHFKIWLSLCSDTFTFIGCLRDPDAFNFVGFLYAIDTLYSLVN